MSVIINPEGIIASAGVGAVVVALTATFLFITKPQLNPADASATVAPVKCGLASSERDLDCRFGPSSEH